MEDAKRTLKRILRLSETVRERESLEWGALPQPGIQTVLEKVGGSSLTEMAGLPRPESSRSNSPPVQVNQGGQGPRGNGGVRAGVRAARPESVCSVRVARNKPLGYRQQQSMDRNSRERQGQQVRGWSLCPHHNWVWARAVRLL